MIKVNKKLLKKVVENNMKCLCCLNKICPCAEFMTDNFCRCGVFETKVKIPKELL